MKGRAFERDAKRRRLQGREKYRDMTCNQRQRGRGHAITVTSSRGQQAQAPDAVLQQVLPSGHATVSLQGTAAAGEERRGRGEGVREIQTQV